MNNTSNSQNSRQMPWWHREKRDGLKDRLQRIQQVNDPTTYTDEVLTASKILLLLLLSFSGVLGALSYFQNFSISFPIEIAIFLALVLTVVIEWGKNKAATWAVRIPFFQGWNSISSTPANTVIFGGLVLVAIATFTMSVYNSTKGGEQLARMLSHEKNKAIFTPDTRTIDEQISNAQKNVSQAPLVKWKGKQYYQDPKAVRATQKTIENLSRQRETIISAQLDGFKKEEAVQNSQTNFAAKLVLASGGWIEFLQVMLIFLRVACEKNLDGRQSPRTISFTGPSKPVLSTDPGRIGFNIGQDGNVRRADNEDYVSQLPRYVTQDSGTSPIMTAEEALKWFETELRREPSNLNNKFAKNETVVNRIYKKLNRAEEFLSRCPDETIPAEAANRFKTYLVDNLFQVIPYDNQEHIIGLINQKSAHAN